MTYGEAKSRVLKILDETKPKADILQKLPSFFDIAQLEVAAVAPLKKSVLLEKGKGEFSVSLPDDFWRVRRVWVVNENGRTPLDRYFAYPHELRIFMVEALTLELEYNARPTTIDALTTDDFPLELSDEANDAMLFFVAAQCHSTEYDQRFFNSFYAQYQGRLQNLAANEPAVVTVVGGGGW